VFGAVLSRRLIGKLGVGHTIVWGAVGCTVGGFLIPLATRGFGVWWIAGGLAVFSISSVVYNVAQVSLRQAICPPELLGRMNATMRFLVWGPMPIGALIGGALGGVIGLRPTLWVAAIAGLVSPLFVIFSPVRRQHEIPGEKIIDPTPSLITEPTAAGPSIEP
jgi:MFS family permease